MYGPPSSPSRHVYVAHSLSHPFEFHVSPSEYASWCISFQHLRGRLGGHADNNNSLKRQCNVHLPSAKVILIILMRWLTFIVRCFCRECKYRNQTAYEENVKHLFFITVPCSTSTDIISFFFICLIAYTYYQVVFVCLFYSTLSQLNLCSIRKFS